MNNSYMYIIHTLFIKHPLYYSKYLEGANNDYIIDKADFPPMSFEP